MVGAFRKLDKLAVYLSGVAANDDGTLTGDAANSTSMSMTVNNCPADLNGDGVVNGADLAALLAAWGSGDNGADLNNDGLVDGADLAIMLAGWGDCSNEGLRFWDLPRVW